MTEGGVRYLNRKRLPKPKGKTGPVRVLLSHADELLLKAPEADLGEFGSLQHCSRRRGVAPAVERRSRPRTSEEPTMN